MNKKHSLLIWLGLVLASSTASASAVISETITEDTTLNVGDKIEISDAVASTSGIQTGTTPTVTINFLGENEISIINPQGKATGINLYSISGTSNLDINGNDILKINVEAKKSSVGIYSRTTATLTVNPELDIKVKNQAEADDLVGIYAHLGNNIFNNNVTIDTYGDYAAVRLYGVYNLAETTFNKKLDINVTGKMHTSSFGYSAGIDNSYSGKLTVNGKTNVTITDTAQVGENNGYTFGIASLFGTASNKTSAVFNEDVNIYASNTNGVAVGLFTQEDGEILLRDNVSITVQGEHADTAAVVSSYDSLIDISKSFLSSSSDAAKVNINGDIVAIENSQININAGTGSVINSTVNNDGLSTISLSLHNNATWNNTGASDIKNVKLNNGFIKQSSIDGVNISNLSGTGTVLFRGAFADKGIININNSAVGSILNISSDQISDTTTLEQATETLNNLKDKVNTVDASDMGTSKIMLKEGLINPGVTANLHYFSNDDNQISDIRFDRGAETQTMSAIKNVAAINIISWRQETSSLRQRMGDLRKSSETNGAWVRTNNGKFEYKNDYKNKYNFFQAGMDKLIDKWRVGLALSYNDGETTYNEGKGTNQSTSVTMYGTYLASKGQYFDAYIKEGFLKNKYKNFTEAGNTFGSYNSLGSAISGEYGIKIDLHNGWYLTPQTQFTFMHIGSEKYTTNNGIEISQDSLNSYLGRAGLEVEKQINEKASVYAKYSLLHDFAGKAKTNLRHQDIKNSYSQDIGGSWSELGAGTNYNISESTYIYAEAIRSFGGSFETPWEINAGLRVDF